MVNRQSRAACGGGPTRLIVRRWPISGEVFYGGDSNDLCDCLLSFTNFSGTNFSGSSRFFGAAVARIRASAGRWPCRHYSDTMEILFSTEDQRSTLGRATGRKNTVKFLGFFHEDYQQMKTSDGVRDCLANAQSYRH
jgi:hypothetical protein